MSWPRVFAAGSGRGRHSEQSNTRRLRKQAARRQRRRQDRELRDLFRTLKDPIESLDEGGSSTRQ